MLKKIKVKMVKGENDSYNELYKVIDVVEGESNNKYFARHTYYGGTWYFVCDPLGYCELDSICPDDYIFIVCDKNGNELFEDGNDENISKKFPTLEKKAIQVWDDIKEKYPIKKTGLNDWLHSFISQILKETILKNENCIYENWTTFWHQEKCRKLIKSFEYLGETINIIVTTQKHKYCKAEWLEYCIESEVHGIIKYLGADFEPSNHGESYGRNEAKNIVIDALKSIYNKDIVSYIQVNSWGNYEKKLKLYNAVEILLNGNYDRNFVNEIIEQEKSKPTFYTSSEKILKDYPECIRDYNLIY